MNDYGFRNYTGFEIEDARKSFEYCMASIASKNYEDNRRQMTLVNRMQNMNVLADKATVYKRYLDSITRMFGENPEVNVQINRVTKALKLCQSTAEAFDEAFDDLFPNEHTYSASNYDSDDCEPV